MKIVISLSTEERWGLCNFNTCAAIKDTFLNNKRYFIIKDNYVKIFFVKNVLLIASYKINIPDENAFYLD